MTVARVAWLGLAVAVGLSASIAGTAAEAAGGRPNIVVLYADDIPPKAQYLMNDPTRTPAMAKFSKNGVRFKFASGSTPRCCPGKANTYTGMWSHNNGVTENDAGPYRPYRSVAIKLRKKGYFTIYSGKFLNRFREYVEGRRSMLRYARGWSRFDVIYLNEGRFYDYPWWSRSSVTRHGKKPADHSSYVATKKVVKYIRNAPRSKPIFAFVHLFSGHAPNLPMPRFIGHPKCKDIEPYSSPAWNEADVSDKPAYVRDAAKLPGDGYGLRTLCEEFMTIDWSLRKIRRALKKTGRLNDTLILFTSDNGMGWGDHRLRNKSTPYATPVPLYALWPRRLRDVKRTVDEPVSNVDLAPTFCAIAGCSIPNADGTSFLPLLTGERQHLDRCFVYIENLHPAKKGEGRPAWYGLETTKKCFTTHWLYVEYASGETELYDLDRDPYMLANLADTPGHADEVQELHDLLHREVIRPNGVTFRSN